ncbi:unnamed protein product [Cuscuta epithymum]|uniref:Uncharacterized protein n=1 Tax=Cuscuta epithymum TaxID=186058 RepID=A0AAV0G3Q4_9ASTE|nr:unnamed protein product [Cuscuta epithymum]
MAERTLVTSSSPALDLDSLRSRIVEFRDILQNSKDAPALSSSDTEKLLNDCTLQFESKIDQILSDTSDIDLLANGDIDELVGYFQNEQSSLEGENEEMSKEIEELSRRYVEESEKLGCEVEGLCCSLDLLESQVGDHACCSGEIEDEVNLRSTHEEFNFKLLELSNQLEKSKTAYKTLQDLEGAFKRLEAIETLDSTLNGLHVAKVDGNHISLSLRTCIPNNDSSLCQEKFDSSSGLFDQYHKLEIELVEGTMELKHAEIYPNDVQIGEIVDAVKSFRQLYSPMLDHEGTAYLEWFVRRVQDQIVLSKKNQ